MLERNRDYPYGDEQESKSRLYGAIISGEDVIEIRKLSDSLIGIVRPLEKVEGEETLITWKPPREIHLLNADTYREAIEERDRVRGSMRAIDAIDVP